MGPRGARRTQVKRRSWRRIGVGFLLVLIAALLAVTVPLSASPGPSRAAGFGRTHGAGTNSPVATNGLINYRYRCYTSPMGRPVFKVSQASIYMWASGARIKGLQFKYKLRPLSEGLGSTQNWSDNVAVSFNQGTSHGQWMRAGPIGGVDASDDWEFEVKLKYPRSLRRAYRYQYSLSFTMPDNCGLGMSRGTITEGITLVQFPRPEVRRRAVPPSVAASS